MMSALWALPRTNVSAPESPPPTHPLAIDLVRQARRLVRGRAQRALVIARDHHYAPVPLYSPICLAMITFMISLVPAKIRCTRASMNARVTGYSSM